MKRWHEDVVIMERRKKRTRITHWVIPNGGALGYLRKNGFGGLCDNRGCAMCSIIRGSHRIENRRNRHASKRNKAVSE